MQKIIPHLWFNKEAKEAAAFYTFVFPQSKIIHTSQIHDTPSGSCDIVSFELWNKQFMAISAGPLFSFNPSISFIVNFDPLFFGQSPENNQAALNALNTVWDKLAEGGKVLMPIDAYPFSKRYGWLQDKYGVSWQLMLTNPDGEQRPAIVPSLLFTGSICGKAEEAINFYQSVFKHAQAGSVHHYPAGMEPDKEGSLMFGDVKLEDTWLAAMDSARQHGFSFNEAVSFMVTCADQEEIDYYWQQLSAVPEAEQCGWLKDKYGLSWQITSAEMETMMQQGTQDEINRITQAFLPMKKIDIAAIKKAVSNG
ncbi:VOC family protein [Foetidibacter luteolus]|uniref:VOC family protein n=1 Tax=Foetidibacter luteolus TaxID=2608880 RepID=UPI00129B308D|nr:VOC family protein [Foetidibacter luteolus]